MSKNLLALHGGSPVICGPLEPLKSMGEEEVVVVSEAVEEECFQLISARRDQASWAVQG